MKRLAKMMMVCSIGLVGSTAAPARAGFDISVSYGSSSAGTTSSNGSVTIYGNQDTTDAGEGSLTFTPPSTSQLARGSSANVMLGTASTAATTMSTDPSISATVTITVTVTSTTNSSMSGTIVVDDMLGGDFQPVLGSTSPAIAQLSTNNLSLYSPGGGPLNSTSITVDGTTFSLTIPNNGSDANPEIFTSGTTYTRSFASEGLPSLVISPSIVPEPPAAILLLSGLGLGGLGMSAAGRVRDRVASAN